MENPQTLVRNNNSPEDESTENDPLQERLEEEKQKQTFFESLTSAIKKATLEPVLILYVSSYMITVLTTQNVILDKVCRVHLNFSNEICDAVHNQDMESENIYEREIQKISAKAMAWNTYMTATIPCILGLLVGPFSDKTGYRKAFVMMPILGQIGVCTTLYIMDKYFPYTTLEAMVFSVATIEGITGGLCILSQSSFSFISVITNEKERTFRIGLLNFCLVVGFPTGMGLSGVLLKSIGYRGCYIVSVSVHVLNMLYNTFILKDPGRSIEQKQHDGKGVFHFVKTFFDVSNIKETVRVVFKDGPNKRRLRMCVLLSVVTILFGPMFGEISVMYMNTRYRFNWDEVKFSIFQTYNFVTHTLGTIFSIIVFSKYLQWHDSLLGIISTVSKIAASFVYCFAPNEKIFFAAPLVEILNGTSLLAMRSMVSKLVAHDELGKVNSVFGLTENLMPLVYVPLYTKVYTATMEVLPGAVFLMGASMTTPAVAVFTWLFCEHRKQVRRLRHEKRETDLEQ